MTQVCMPVICGVCYYHGEVHFIHMYYLYQRHTSNSLEYILWDIHGIGQRWNNIDLLLYIKNEVWVLWKLFNLIL